MKPIISRIAASDIEFIEPRKTMAIHRLQLNAMVPTLGSPAPWATEFSAGLPGVRMLPWFSVKRAMQRTQSKWVRSKMASALHLLREAGQSFRDGATIGPQSIDAVAFSAGASC
jgi:hypothetical protein